MPPIYHTSNPDEKAVMTENVHLFMAIMIWIELYTANSLFCAGH